MKICWDNIEGLRYIGQGRWRKGTNTWIYKGACKTCGEPFFIQPHNKGLYCERKCSRIGKTHSDKTKKKISIASKRHRHTEETKRKMSKSHKGKILSIEHKKKISEANKGKNNPMYGKRGKENHKWKGGYSIKNIPLYDTYATQIDWCEPVRRNQKDLNTLEVKCTWCGKWFVPKKWSIDNRIQILHGNDNHRGEGRFYCSKECKKLCPIYNKTVRGLIKDDAIKSGRINWKELRREVQPELRKMVFERDKWTCQKCKEKGGALHCHHIEGIRWEPLQSADMDMCVTVCKECHKEIHKIPGCGYQDMVCKDF